MGDLRKCRLAFFVSFFGNAKKKRIKHLS